MASGQTSNYGLNQWAAEDPVLRTDFNQDNAKLDAALEATPNFAVGSYAGNGWAFAHPWFIFVPQDIGSILPDIHTGD